MSKHALLSASSAAMWINCPPSARLCEGIADKGSSYASEGTLAHAIAEKLIRQEVFDEDVSEDLIAFQSDEGFNAEMGGYVQIYVDIVLEKYRTALANKADPLLRVEEKLDFSHLVPDGFGTGDCIIVSNGNLEIIDLKYGKGVPVSAVNNPQIRLYALGALELYDIYYGINNITMTIVQPRLDSISSETMSVEELKAWGETVVKPAAKLAYSGKGEFNPSDYACRWCKVKATCKARADKAMEALAYEMKDPRLFDNDEIGAILKVARSLATWAKDVETYVTEQLLANHKIDGWKLVEGRSNRTITDKEQAALTLLSVEGKTDSDVFKPKELKSLTELEKGFGKKAIAEMLKDLIVKPQGKPALVSEDDPRPAINSVENDFDNINFN